MSVRGVSMQRWVVLVRRDFSPLSLVGENDVFYFAGEIENVIVAAEELGLNVVNCDNEEGGVSVVDSLINAATAKVFHLLQVGLWHNCATSRRMHIPTC